MHEADAAVRWYASYADEAKKGDWGSRYRKKHWSTAQIQAYEAGMAKDYSLTHLAFARARRLGWDAAIKRQNKVLFPHAYDEDDEDDENAKAEYAEIRRILQRIDALKPIR